jgi:hypothetical protein
VPGAGGLRSQGPRELVTPPEVVELLRRRRTPRRRATKKILDVLGRLVVGEGPLDRIRTAWVMGSYARGAPDVGDVDLVLEIDEPRSAAQQGLDSYYRRAHPYAEVVGALGCGAGSFVNVEVLPVFSEERDLSGPVAESDALPLMGHVITDEPFDPQPILLWLRGEGLDAARARLEDLPLVPEARRFERTTTVAVLDDLEHELGARVAFQLAMQVREGVVSVEPILLQPAPVPDEFQDTLERRYSRTSIRKAAASAALSHLRGKGVEPEQILLIDEPAVDWLGRLDDCLKPEVKIDFNLFRVYLFAGGRASPGTQRLHIWPRSKAGPWLALRIVALKEAESSNAREYFRSLFGVERGER